MRNIRTRNYENNLKGCLIVGPICVRNLRFMWSS